MIAAVGIKTRTIINARVSDQAVRKDVKRLATWGGGTYLTSFPLRDTSNIQLVIFVTGFIIWNLDTAFCSQLTAIKRTIGMPWSFVFEFHGWWHLFTGLGAYICKFAHAHGVHAMHTECL